MHKQPSYIFTDELVMLQNEATSKKYTPPAKSSQILFQSEDLIIQKKTLERIFEYNQNAFSTQCDHVLEQCVVITYLFQLFCKKCEQTLRGVLTRIFFGLVDNEFKVLGWQIPLNTVKRKQNQSLSLCNYSGCNVYHKSYPKNKKTNHCFFPCKLKKLVLGQQVPQSELTKHLNCHFKCLTVKPQNTVCNSNFVVALECEDTFRWFYEVCDPTKLAGPKCPYCQQHTQDIQIHMIRCKKAKLFNQPQIIQQRKNVGESGMAREQKDKQTDKQSSKDSSVMTFGQKNPDVIQTQKFLQKEEDFAKQLRMKLQQTLDEGTLFDQKSFSLEKKEQKKISQKISQKITQVKKKTKKNIFQQQKSKPQQKLQLPQKQLKPQTSLIQGGQTLETKMFGTPLSPTQKLAQMFKIYFNAQERNESQQYLRKLQNLIAHYLKTPIPDQNQVEDQISMDLKRKKTTKKIPDFFGSQLQKIQTKTPKKSTTVPEQSTIDKTLFNDQIKDQIKKVQKDTAQISQPIISQPILTQILQGIKGLETTVAETKKELTERIGVLDNTFAEAKKEFTERIGVLENNFGQFAYLQDQKEYPNVEEEGKELNDDDEDDEDENEEDENENAEDENAEYSPGSMKDFIIDDDASLLFSESTKERSQDPLLIDPETPFQKAMKKLKNIKNGVKQSSSIQLDQNQKDKTSIPNQPNMDIQRQKMLDETLKKSAKDTPKQITPTATPAITLTTPPVFISSPTTTFIIPSTKKGRQKSPKPKRRGRRKSVQKGKKSQSPQQRKSRSSQKRKKKKDQDQKRNK